ncbi:MAG: hypothetical protein F6K65_38780 [Moorea sp. SIO3C2]|nr:hypothetical protein [Moorena sp. SIO3C2]
MVYPTYHGEAMDEIAKGIVAGRYGLFHDIEYKCQIKHLFLSSDGHPTSSSAIPAAKS